MNRYPVWLQLLIAIPLLIFIIPLVVIVWALQANTKSHPPNKFNRIMDKWFPDRIGNTVDTPVSNYEKHNPWG